MIYRKEITGVETEIKDDYFNMKLKAIYNHARPSDGYFSYIGRPAQGNTLPIDMSFIRNGASYNEGFVTYRYGNSFKEFNAATKTFTYYSLSYDNPGNKTGYVWEFDGKLYSLNLYIANASTGKLTKLYTLGGNALAVMQRVYTQSLNHVYQRNIEEHIDETHYDNGDYYLGQETLKNGVYVRDLFGYYRWKQGDYYIGEYFNGSRTGFGYYHFTNGDYYYGDFINNESVGIGTYQYPNGDFYQGTYSNNTRHGFGIYIWHDSNGNPSTSYMGEWVDGKQHGQGKVYSFKKQAIIQDGRFENNVFKG